ncbi:hypothetical protein IH992_02820 [Candidatus Poribacteria bacterium]|nr:hypothetical protein [Candidatus Poribacteria bacterium]
MRTHAGKRHGRLIRRLLFSMLFGLSLSAETLEPTRSALKSQITHIAQQMKDLQTEQEKLLRENEKRTDRINAAKKQLQKRSNPLVEIQLQTDLKASRTLSDQIQVLDGKIYTLTEQSIDVKKRLVNVMNTEIEMLSREADATKDAKQKRNRLSQVLRVQKEKETIQAQIRAESNELLLGLDITLVDTDGPDEIQQKLAIIQDQQDILQTKIKRLDIMVKETKKKLSLFSNMLELLRDIRRGEDDEFDLDRNLRIAELQEDIAQMETTLEVLGAKKSSWQVKEKSLAQKAKQFSQEALKFLKGDSSGGK